MSSFLSVHGVFLNSLIRYFTFFERRLYFECLFHFGTKTEMAEQNLSLTGNIYLKIRINIFQSRQFLGDKNWIMCAKGPEEVLNLTETKLLVY